MKVKILVIMDNQTKYAYPSILTEQQSLPKNLTILKELAEIDVDYPDDDTIQMLMDAADKNSRLCRIAELESELKILKGK